MHATDIKSIRSVRRNSCMECSLYDKYEKFLKRCAHSHDSSRALGPTMCPVTIITNPLKATQKGRFHTCPPALLGDPTSVPSTKLVPSVMRSLAPLRTSVGPSNSLHIFCSLSCYTHAACQPVTDAAILQWAVINLGCYQLRRLRRVRDDTDDIGSWHEAVT